MRMGVEVPLKPMGREDIQKLEAVLLVATVSRRDVIEKMREADPRDRLTWIDSLAIAAGALAREKAGLPLSRIAEELGRGEQTLRAHLAGRTEAGRLIRETYEMLLRGEQVLPVSPTAAEVEELRRRLEEETEARRRLQAKLESAVKALREILRQLES